MLSASWLPELQDEHRSTWRSIRTSSPSRQSHAPSGRGVVGGTGLGESLGFDEAAVRSVRCFPKNKGFAQHERNQLWTAELHIRIARDVLAEGE